LPDSTFQQLFSVFEYPHGSHKWHWDSASVFWVEYCCDGAEKKESGRGIERQGKENDSGFDRRIDILFYGDLREK
jgi:hypothetical protein